MTNQMDDRIIDAHIHVWAKNQTQYPLAPGFENSDLWIPSYEPDDHLEMGKPLGVHRINFVQMTWYGLDHSYILDLIEQCARMLLAAAGVKKAEEAPSYTKIIQMKDPYLLSSR